MPYIAGRRVSLAEWRERQPVRPLVRYRTDDTRVVVNVSEVEESQRRLDAEAWAKAENERRAGLVITHHATNVPMVTAADYPGGPDATTETVLKRQRGLTPGKLAAIADALGVDPSSDAIVAIATENDAKAEYTRSGVRIATGRAPWDTDDDDRDDDAVAKPSARPAQARGEAKGTKAPSVSTPAPEPTPVAVPVEHEPVGKTTHARENAFAEAHGFVNRKNRPSQVGVGRHLRHVRTQARRWGVSEEVADSRLKGHPDDCVFLLAREAESR